MVVSLFCGLPKLAKRMGVVFQADGDETERGNQTGPFVFGGWVAPVLDWQDKLAPEWEERVLNGRPVLPYLHVAELLSRDGRAKYGLTRKQAEARIEKAIKVIRRVPSLTPVWTNIDGGHFRDAFKGTRMIRRTMQPGVFPLEPDYMGFHGFAIAVLIYISKQHPNAETVDFLIEEKPPVTHRMKDFFDSLPQALQARGFPHLVPLIGEFIPGGKKRVPLQAADLMLWYARATKSEGCSEIEQRRFNRLVEGRRGLENGLTRDDVDDLSARSKARNIPSPFPPKPKRQAS